MPPPVEFSSPPSAAGRANIEAALRTAGGSVRFVGWLLPAADLSRLDLHGCHFVRCRASQADFSSADVTDAQFEHCDLSNTKWRGARISAARFASCKLTGGQFQDVTALGVSVSHSLLVNAYLRGLSFRRQTLEGVNFEGADVAQCDFREAQLLECSLREANIAHARFEGADLRGADLGAIRLADAGRFKGAMISKAQATLLLSGLGLKVF
jgi:fluoroquinolone resistance protein